MRLPSPKGSKMREKPHLPGHGIWTPPPRGLRKIERVTVAASHVDLDLPGESGGLDPNPLWRSQGQRELCL